MLKPQDISAAFHARRIRLDQTNPTPAGKKLEHPAARAAMIFADTATLSEITPLLEGGIINGVTTNPSLLKRAGATSWAQAKEIMKSICDALKPFPVSLELTELTPDKMLKQAEELSKLGDNSVIKVPIGGYTAIDPKLDPHTGLKVLRELWKKDIKTNCTLIFNSTQAYWAAMAGATYVSPFLGRLADYAYKHDLPELAPGNSLYSVVDHKNEKGDQHVANTEYVASDGPRKDAGARLIHEIATIFANYDIQTLILAASFRNSVQLSECLLAGADILTVPAKILSGVADHPLTNEGMTSFVADAKVFEK